MCGVYQKKNMYDIYNDDDDVYCDITFSIGIKWDQGYYSLNILGCMSLIGCGEDRGLCRFLKLISG